MKISQILGNTAYMVAPGCSMDKYHLSDITWIWKKPSDDIHNPMIVLGSGIYYHGYLKQYYINVDGINERIIDMDPMMAMKI